MKTKLTIVLALASILGFTSCTAPNGPNTQNGAITGGLLGATAGGIIGHQSGRGLEGALLGGAAGAAAGGVIGNNRDAQRYGRY